MIHREAINWWTDTINTTLFNFYPTVLWDAVKWLIHRRLTTLCIFIFIRYGSVRHFQYIHCSAVCAHCTEQTFFLLLMAPNVWHNCINNMNVLLCACVSVIFRSSSEENLHFVLSGLFFCFPAILLCFLCLLFRELSEIIRVYLILGIEFYLWDRDREIKTQIKIAWERIYS